MMRDSSFGSESFRKGPPPPRSYSDSRSRYDDRSGSNVDYNDSRSYQSQAPNPPGNFGNVGNFNRDSSGPRYENSSRGSRYNEEGSSRYSGSGSQYDGGSNYSNRGPPNFGGGPPNYNNDGPPNYNNNSGPPNYNNSGPGNFGSGGPGPNFGGSGPPARPHGPMGGGGGGGGGGGPPPPSGRNAGYGNVPTENLFSSIQTLSEISKNDFATKIISAVLQTQNLMGAAQQGPGYSGPNFPGNQQGPYDDDQMGGYSDRKKYSSRSSRQGGGRGPPPRHSGPSGGPSRFSRERLRNLRISFPANRSKYDRAFPVKSRSSLSRKRSLSRSTPPRDTSKGKRRRSNSRERRESPRRKEDKDGAINNERDSEEKERVDKEKDDDEESTDKKDDIPLAALYCHMCKHGNFTSVKTYLYHLDGVKHRKTAMAFHARNEATLEYLRKNAKLANVRFGGKDSGVSTSKCTVCSAIIKETFAKHKRLLEHKIVKKFMNPTCCGRYFKTRYDMNEHRLSLPHLRKIYEANEEKKIFLEDVKAKPGKWNHEDIVKQLMSRNPVPEKHLTLDNIPPFDGNTFIGIKFLRPKEATYCKPCKLLLPVGIKSLETHMVSIEHYDNVMDYLREKRKRRMEGGGKKEREGEDGVSDSDDSDEEKNTDGNVDGSRYSRHEREDEEEDDDDDEGAVVVIKGSDDEDEKDDMPYFDEAAHIVLEEIGEDMPTTTKEEDESLKEESKERHVEIENDVENENHDPGQEKYDPEEVDHEVDEEDEIQEVDPEYVPE